MNKEIFNYLINELTQELTRVHGEQDKLDIGADMFHFYSGMSSAIRDCIDTVCRVNARKEMK